MTGYYSIRKYKLIFNYVEYNIRYWTLKSLNIIIKFIPELFGQLLKKEITERIKLIYDISMTGKICICYDQ
ncbi:hypothetical protein BpHYR1_054354 [Brachionus plicatilis]|uniref:Uncharacterized protein n=1 Tax=Brachionus plicatilis TaxID=10195 RepID=A0A3M7RE74_BRAPC|nr:hypothetical protein BpHYR1_054354 [Brachionus plicatilis]